MARTIAEMIAPKVTEQDKTMVDVYGLKSKAADDIQEETQSWLSSFIFGPESGVDMGYAPDIALTPFFSKKGILAALKKFGIGKKGMRQVGKFNRQLNDPDYLYKKHGIQEGGQQKFKRSEKDFIEEDYMTKSERKALNKAEAKEMKEMQEEIAKNPKKWKKKFEEERLKTEKKWDAMEKQRAEDEFFEYGREGFEGSDYEVNFPDPFEEGF